MQPNNRIKSVLLIFILVLTLYPIPLVASDSHKISQDWNINAEINGAQVHILKEEGAFDGYNLFMLRKTSTSTTVREFYLMIVDMEGNVLLNEHMGDGILLADCPAEFIDPNTILTRRPSGAILYHLENGSITDFNFAGHHEFEYNPNSGTFFTFNYQYVDINGTSYLFDMIKEFDRTGSLVWSLDTSTFITPDQYCPYSDRYMNKPDVTHSNTIFYDPEEDTILYNSRNTNTFYLIDHNTSEILWGLGEFGDFTLIDQYGNQKENLFYHAHAVEQVDENVFILFDNDLHNQTSEINYTSRMLEITIDEDTMTAHTSWVWSAPREYYSFIWGDADRLPNGNRLGVFGPWYHFDSSPYGGRVVEVNPEGEVVWEMTFENNANYNYGIYKIERFRNSPITTETGMTHGLVGENIVVDWDVFYNYRPKRTISGSYELYLDDALFESGQLSYDKYWRPSELEFDLGIIDQGLHNATLLFNEPSGSRTISTIFVNISLFYLEFQGPLSFVVGDPNNLIRWTGDTLLPYQCTISVDENNVSSFTWNGSDITLDVSTYGVGNHSLQIELFNGSDLVYSASNEFQIVGVPFSIPIELILLIATVSGGIIVIFFIFKRRR